MGGGSLSVETALTCAEVIREQIEELKTVDIHVMTCLLSVKTDILWDRICERVAREPRRKNYNEHERSWMETVLDFYGTQDWDVIVDNTDKSIKDVASDLLSSISAHVQKVSWPPAGAPIGLTASGPRRLHKLADSVQRGDYAHVDLHVACSNEGRVAH